jgi:transcriptional regulator HilA, main transcriptional regulator of SPI1
MGMDTIQCNDYIFDDFVVNASGVMTFHGQDISIPPKEFQVLITLLEGRGNLVLKNFIIDRVWGDTLVGDESLTRCIYSLRRLLRESKNNKFIETVYGKGYRFCKPVAQVPHSRQDRSNCTLAVFPFGGTDRAQAVVLQALLLDQCTQAHLPGLSIVPAMLTRDLLNIDEIAELCQQLEIDCYLSGELAQVGNGQVMSVELIDAATQRLLFCDTRQLEPGEALSGHLRQLRETLFEHLPLQMPELPARAASDELLAHVMARRCLRRRAHGDANLAQQYLQMGLLQNPDHVPSLVSMAETHLALSMQGGGWPQRAMADAEQLLEQAGRLAPSYAMVPILMAWLQSLTRDTPIPAGNLLRRAEASGNAPGELYLYLGLYWCAQGELELALQQMDLCLVRADDVALARIFRLWFMLALGRHAEALDGALQDGAALESSPLLCSVLAWGLAENGDVGRATLYADMSIENAPASLPERILHATVQAVSGAASSGRDLLNRWTGEARARYRCPGLLANLALTLGDPALARTLIGFAREQRCLWWPMVRVMPRMAAFLAAEHQLGAMA